MRMSEIFDVEISGVCDIRMCLLSGILTYLKYLIRIYLGYGDVSNIWDIGISEISDLRMFPVSVNGNGTNVCDM